MRRSRSSLLNSLQFLKEFETLFNRNRIFIERTSGVAAVDPEVALNYSWSGPILRATGVDYDVRVNEPYSSYEDFDFEIPVGTTGDVYDRYIVRNEEMWQSLRIIEQALDKIEKEPKAFFMLMFRNFTCLQKKKFIIIWKH